MTSASNDRPTPAMTPQLVALSATLGKLETLLDCAMPGPGAPPIDDAAIATQKGRILLELSRLGTIPEGTVLPEPLATQIRRARTRLAEEQLLLKRRLDAAQIIASLIAEVFVAEDWDGTYEAHPATPHPTAARTVMSSAPAPGSGTPARAAIGRWQDGGRA